MTAPRFVAVTDAMLRAGLALQDEQAAVTRISLDAAADLGVEPVTVGDVLRDVYARAALKRIADEANALAVLLDALAATSIARIPAAPLPFATKPQLEEDDRGS